MKNGTTEGSSNKPRRKENSEKSLREKEFKVFFTTFCPRTLVVRVTTSKLTLAKALSARPCVLLLNFLLRFAGRDFPFHHQIKADENYITKRGKKINVCKDTGVPMYIYLHISSIHKPQLHIHIHLYESLTRPLTPSLC